MRLKTGSVLFLIYRNGGIQPAVPGTRGLWAPWEAGLLSQADRINDELSQYFNIFEAPGGRWVRFTYTDKDGTHEALWETHIYKKHVEGKNDLAKEFMTSSPE